MGNIIDYVNSCGHLGFREKPFSLVDSLILSQLSYLRYDGLVSGLENDAAAPDAKSIADIGDVDSLFEGVREDEQNRALYRALIASRRFGTARLHSYVNEFDEALEKQFAAVSFILDDGVNYIAFRGTDATLVGWKEDFNMAYLCPVPSQVEGVEYLNAVSRQTPGRIMVGGHSKGGNIASYAAMKCTKAVQDRIVAVYSHDGPGFRKEVFRGPEYARIRSRIHKVMPQSAVIGIILHNHEKYRIIKSKSLFALSQHDPFTWQIDNDDFIYLKSLKNSSLLMDRTIGHWLNSIRDEDRKLFIDTLFDVINATNAGTFEDLTQDWRKNASAIIRSIAEIDPKTRKFMTRTIGSVFVYAVRTAKNAKKQPIRRLI